MAQSTTSARIAMKRAKVIESEGLEVLRIAASDVLRDPLTVADGLVRLCAAGPSTT